MKNAILSLSGGMDSSTLLLRLLAKGYKTTAISFNYGQKHNIELIRASELVSYLKKSGYELVHKVITLDGLAELLNSNLVTGGEEVPEGHYEEETMKQTVVPNRNKIMNSIIQAIALSVYNKTKKDTVIAMGIHAGDHAIYPDCRVEFRDVDFEAFKIGNWDADQIGVYTPYLNKDKYDILQDGLDCCNILNIDFDEVYAKTNTSYKPTPEGYSDYKSASSVERIEAFLKLGRPDPVQYADKSGLVSWDEVTLHVKKVLTTA